MITTNSDSANGVLNRIETESGEWTSYGNDGRHTLELVEGQAAGNGFRARFIDNPHGGDYGWGPLGSNEAEAIALLLAEFAVDHGRPFAVTKFRLVSYSISRATSLRRHCIREWRAAAICLAVALVATISFIFPIAGEGCK